MRALVREGQVRTRLRIRTLGPTLSLGPATWVELVRLAARDRTDAASRSPNRRLFASTNLAANFPECLARLHMDKTAASL